MQVSYAFLDKNLLYKHPRLEQRYRYQFPQRHSEADGKSVLRPISKTGWALLEGLKAEVHLWKSINCRSRGSL